MSRRPELLPAAYAVPAVATCGLRLHASPLLPSVARCGCWHPRLPASHPSPLHSPLAGCPTHERLFGASELHLALFLLLAGFFVLLLSLAEPAPERARAVLDSLALTFSGKQPVAAHGSEVLPGNTIEAPAPPRFRLGEPLTAAEQAAGLVARVRIADDRLFDAQDQIPRWHWFLLSRLASRSGPQAGAQELAVLVPGKVWHAAPERTRARLQHVVDRLLALGAARAQLSVGVAPGEGRMWIFLLRHTEDGKSWTGS